MLIYYRNLTGLWRVQPRVSACQEKRGKALDGPPMCICGLVATASCKRPVCCEQRSRSGEDGCTSCRMGRGRRWAPEELPHLAEAYVATTTNPIVGTDHEPDRGYGPDIGEFSG
jgi:hypothetical protein